MYYCWPQQEDILLLGQQGGGEEQARAGFFLLVFHDAVMEGCFCCQNVCGLPEEMEKACK